MAAFAANSTNSKFSSASENFFSAKPNTDYAYKNAQKYYLPKHMDKFIEMFEKK